MKNVRPLLFFVSLLLIVGLACRFGADTPPPQTERPIETREPTIAPEPTEEPTELPTLELTELPTEVPFMLDYFTEEFDQDPGELWLSRISGPGADAHASSVKTEFSDSRMRIELPERDLYFYYFYLGNTYENVRIDLRADNRGVNTNNVSLICRVGDDGWYEWSVGSGGDWILYARTDKYNLMAKGGTTYLKQGKEVNEYGLECKDNTIRMFINGQEIKQSPFTDKKYGLRDGAVAFNISSLHVTPVVVEVDWFKVSEAE
ncbi:MAG: hypothetical protein EHM40_00325 [Chloroflexi bacterium]|nr:MAG: hypothetical protein EHM40_16255 [Chloroflexota bacterium]RPI96852.1 MAG: hypothetical protein EHM40_00325 [Chloroflexota bacterium]